MVSSIIQDSTVKAFNSFAGDTTKLNKKIQYKWLLDKCKDEVELLISVGMLGYRISNYKFVEYPDIEPDNSFNYVLSNVIQNYDKKVELRKYLATLPKLYVDCISILFTNKFYSNKVEDIAIERGTSTYTRHELLSILPKPSFAIASTDIDGLEEQEIHYPVTGIHVNSKYSKFTVGYIDIDGIVVKSNVSSITIRSAMLSKAVTRKGRLYFMYLHSARNRLKGATAIAQIVDDKVHTINHTGTTLNNEEELRQFLQEKPRTSKFVIGVKGLVEIKSKRYTRVLKATDYIIDEDTYEIVKLIFTIKDKEYIVPAKVDEIELNKTKFRLVIYEWDNEITAVNYIGKFRDKKCKG